MEQLFVSGMKIHNYLSLHRNRRGGNRKEMEWQSCLRPHDLVAVVGRGGLVLTTEVVAP